MLSRTADRSRPSPTLPKFDAMDLVVGTNRDYVHAPGNLTLIGTAFETGQLLPYNFLSRTNPFICTTSSAN